MNLVNFVNRLLKMWVSSQKSESLKAPWKIEFEDRCTEEDIYNCFRLILGRNPSEAEWDGHKTYAGNKLSDVVASYANSLEFKRRRLGMLQDTERTLVDLGAYKMYASESDTAVGIHVLRSKAYEPHVTGAIKAVLKPGMCFVDIGANIGFFSMLAASVVGDAGKVFAFEPYQYNVKMLYHSVQVNGFSQINIFPFAVANKNGLFIYSNEASNGKIEAVSDMQMSFSSDLVYAVRLDDFLPSERLDIIKIDVEGAEYMALSGACNLLRKHRPVIFSEFSPPALMTTSNVSAEDYLQLLLVDATYGISIINTNNQIIACGRDTARVIKFFEDARTDHIDIVAQPLEDGHL